MTGKSAEKAERRRRKYSENAKAIERLLCDYAAGESHDDQNNPVSAARVASEIVGKYRAMGCCLDRNSVSFDGPMIKDIEDAMRAAFERGRLERA